MAAPKFTTVDEYLGSLEPPKGATLKAVIDCILSEFPLLEVKLAWNVPQIHFKGKYVFGMSAAKGHLSLAPWSQEVMAAFADRLSGYTVKANLFTIPVDWEVDEELLHDMVTMRLAELES